MATRQAPRIKGGHLDAPDHAWVPGSKSFPRALLSAYPVINSSLQALQWPKYWGSPKSNPSCQERHQRVSTEVTNLPAETKHLLLPQTHKYTSLMLQASTISHPSWDHPASLPTQHSQNQLHNSQQFVLARGKLRDKLILKFILVHKITIVYPTESPDQD